MDRAGTCSARSGTTRGSGARPSRCACSVPGLRSDRLALRDELVAACGEERGGHVFVPGDLAQRHCEQLARRVHEAVEQLVAGLGDDATRLSGEDMVARQAEAAAQGGGEPDCEANPSAEGCPGPQAPDCEATPNAPGCPSTPEPDCVANPGAEGCPDPDEVDCERFPDAFGCSGTEEPDCEADPEAEGCEQDEGEEEAAHVHLPAPRRAPRVFLSSFDFLAGLLNFAPVRSAPSSLARPMRAKRRRRMSASSS